VPEDSRQFRHKIGAFTRSCAQIRALPQTSAEAETNAFAGTSVSGETRTRTGDTTIFSRAVTAFERRRIACKPTEFARCAR
jgi:hypothetical protein